NATYPVAAGYGGQAEPRSENSQAAAPPRLRQFFPETLASFPEVLTDDHGVASLTVPMADSITTWRVGAFASSLSGEMGSTQAAIRVFQDFFVDIDMPVSLTQKDEVSIPVAVYNYLPERQTVTVTVDRGNWFTLEDEPTHQITLGKNEVGQVTFRLRADRVGTHRLTVTAHGAKLSDAIRREVEVLPDGMATEQTWSDRLTRAEAPSSLLAPTSRPKTAKGPGTPGRFSVGRKLLLPEDAIDGASRVLVTVYPGIFSQLVQGLDAIFQMPGGCFEQTSSSTYPDVLALDYLKRTRHLTPELQMKAEGFVNSGYQRLLTFEVKGGGFSVFGQVPANPILTAYGLMEFSDMAKVHDVDPNLIARTRSWLLAQQQQDGSWSAGREGFYAEGWRNIPNSSLVSTAYITWGLLNTGEKGHQVQKALGYLEQHLGQVQDPYTAALVANALVDGAPRSAAAEKALGILIGMRVEDQDVVFWRTRISTAAFGTGPAGDIETTALAAMALIDSGRYTTDANKAVTYLMRTKDPHGTWYSTQATVLALKTLLRSADQTSEKANASIDVRINGKTATTLHLTPANADVFQQVDVTPFLQKGGNFVELGFAGEGNCLYQITERYYRPWTDGAMLPKPSQLALDVHYDRTKLEVDDTAQATVTVRNLTHGTANNTIVDVGIPPGFDVQNRDLEALVEKRTIAKFSNTGRQLILYCEKLDPQATAVVRYHLRARFPLRVQAPRSRAYDYYNPSREAVTPPILMQVTRR
ncbi:MAG: alpha-2-macroglobulin family protein, partial [Candidatus Xenobia bacterium]